MAASFKIFGVKRFLGNFETEAEAACAYDLEATKNGRSVNFPKGNQEKALTKCSQEPNSKSRGTTSRKASVAVAPTVARGRHGGARSTSGARSTPTPMVPCGHRFCAPCLQNLAASEVADGHGRPTRQSIALVCPICRSRVREDMRKHQGNGGVL